MSTYDLTEWAPSLAPAAPTEAATNSPPERAWLREAIPAEVLTAIEDKARFSPMLAGASRIRARGKHAELLVRTATEEVAIQAPAKLLNSVFDLCDGTRTIDEIVLSQPEGAAREEFADFLDFLRAEGAVIDGNLACVEAAKNGFQFSPVGLTAPPKTTGKIAHRFAAGQGAAAPVWTEQAVAVPDAPLAPFFAARVTRYTFDDRSIPATALHQLLWSLAGVVRLDHPRLGKVAPQRTLASAGGMHLLEIFVVLQRQVGEHAPGAYRVHYPGERLIALERLESDASQLPLAFGKPWELTYAVGAIFVAADPVVGAMRYRSRSLQYLFMEAGAALHNGALSADALELAYATLGGYYETPAKQLCALDRQLVLGSAIFGAKPSPAQEALAVQAPDVDFAWIKSDSELFSMGFHLARAKTKTLDDDRPYTWGRSEDPRLAMRKAVAEAIEREGFREPRHIAFGPIAQVPGALHPSRFVSYTERQYASARFPYQRFSETQAYPWATGTDLVTGGQVRVLAELVYSRASLAGAGFATTGAYTQTTSSGCAAGVSPEDATLRALLEVVERDAFMRHWLQQTPGQCIDQARLPADMLGRIAAMEATGCTLVVQQLASAHAHVVLVAAQHPGRHFTTMGTAAGFDFVQTLAGAMDEIEARVYAWLHGHVPEISDPQDTATTEHHFELYGLKRFYKRADRVLFPATPALVEPPPQAFGVANLVSLVASLATTAGNPIAIDITPARNHVDQGRTPLTVIKALAPGLLPISFGYQQEPQGMVSRVHAGARFPHPFP